MRDRPDVMSDEVLTEHAAAKLLGVTPEALTQRRARAKRRRDASVSPPWYLTPTGAIRYKRSEVLAWKRAREVESEAELVPVDPTAPKDSDA